MRPISGRSSPRRFRASSSRQGFTITELLIAATISLILTYAVIQMFDYVASEARYGRASIELASQLRNASRRISTDLACATAPVRPFADRNGQGYFEYLEGPGTDSVAMVYDYTAGTYTPKTRTNAIDGLSTVAVETSLGGDIDDVLMFTAYNPDEPFRGRYTPYTLVGTNWVRGQTRVEESKYAEIAIWTVRDPSNGRVRLYRRTLLIRPDLSASGYYTAAAPQFPMPSPVPADQVKYRLQTFYQENDLSVRYDSAAGAFKGNTLGDLSRRENRFAHQRTNIPYLYPIDADALQVQNPASLPVAPGWLLTNDATNNRYFEGNDVLLAEVLAFDVKAFDPLASIRLDTNSFAMTPSDPGYLASAGPGGGPVASYQTGAFVDLGYDMTLGSPLSGASTTWFSGNGQTKSKLVTPSYFAAGGAQYAFRTYCTWSLFYEMNARDVDGDGTITVAEGDENGDGVPDGGNNQIDDNNNGVVDELAEWDTAPPYPNPLRGVQVTLRVMEPNSRQVRQMSVVQNFTGE